MGRLLPKSPISYFALGYFGFSETTYYEWGVWKALSFSVVLGAVLGVWIGRTGHRMTYFLFWGMGLVFGLVANHGMATVSLDWEKKISLQRILFFPSQDLLSLEDTQQILTVSSRQTLNKNKTPTEVEIELLEAWKGKLHWGVLRDKRVLVQMPERFPEKIPTVLCPKAIVQLHIPKKGDYLYRRIQKESGFYLKIPVNSCRVVDWKMSPAGNTRHFVRNLLEKGKIYGEWQNTSMAILFGDSSYLEFETKETLKQGGTLHLFAASGLHLGILWLVVWGVFSPLPYPVLSRFLAVLLCGVYLVALQFPISLFRAYVFLVVTILSFGIYRKISRTDTLLMTVLVCYLWDTDSIREISFFLSFGAVLGIFFISPGMEYLLQKLPSFFRDNLSVSIGASLGTFPTLAIGLGGWSLGSVAINLVLVPLFGILLPLLYAGLLLQTLVLWASVFWDLQVVADLVWTNFDFLFRFFFWLSTKSTEWAGWYLSSPPQKLLVVLFLFGFLFFGLQLYHYSRYLQWKNTGSWVYWKWGSWALGVCFFLIPFFFRNTDTESKAYILVSNQNYIFFDTKKLMLGGNCRYYSRIWKEKIHNFPCGDGEEIEFYEEFCLETARKRQNTCPSAKIVRSETIPWKDWNYPLDFFSTTPSKTKPSVVEFLSPTSTFLFFDPQKDSLLSLQKKTKELPEGKIVLLLPSYSKESWKDWTFYQRSLGIPSSWTFVSDPFEDEIPLLQTDSHQRIP